MSHPPDVKKQYGIVTAIGTKVGERARSEPGLIEQIRAAADLPSFQAIVRRAATTAPPALVEQFLGTIVTQADWVQWRSRLLLQAKMVRDGQKPAEDHRSGKGVGGP